MRPYTYLLINFSTIIVCFLFSFHPNIRFNRFFSTFLKSSTIVAIPFLIWDNLFTKQGIWWFNSDYTLGINIARLPIEECLFFYCIPFSCLFTYYCLTKFYDFSKINKYSLHIVALLVCVCMSISLLFIDKTYTVVTAILLLVSLLYLQWIAKVKWIGQASFIYCILLLGFLPVNGILTGTGLESPVVNYNPKTFLNIRILTIPIEDVFYGYTMYILNIYFFIRTVNLSKKLHLT